MTAPSARKLAALRNLAERPGTEAEGKVARAMLEKLTGREYAPPRPPAPERPITGGRFNGEVWEFLQPDGTWSTKPAWSTRPAQPRPKAPRKKPAPPKVPEYFRDKVKLAMKVRQRFPIGTTVYYNAPGWASNSMGTVTGYRPAGYKVRVWFDQMGGVKEVDACSSRGWHMTVLPMNEKTAAKMQKKGVKWV